MANREPLLINEYYHAYNRGADKRIIFDDVFDILRFLQSMQEFNSVEPIGSIYEKNYHNKEENVNFGGFAPKAFKSDRLVKIVAYCLNPNHFHLILSPLVENGISEFMKRLGGGYTTYYNIKNNRKGVLFQGVFKSKHIDSDSYLRFLSAYVNLNFKVHKKFEKNNGKNQSVFKSSWDEYLNAKIIKKKGTNEHKIINNKDDICDKSMILSHFNSIEEYKRFAIESLREIKRKRYNEDDIIKDDFSL
ncbi:MAG: transposase [Patescibacteria group bacterium]